MFMQGCIFLILHPPCGGGAKVGEKISYFREIYSTPLCCIWLDCNNSCYTNILIIFLSQNRFRPPLNQILNSVHPSPQQRRLVEQSPQQRRLVEQSPQQHLLVAKSPQQHGLVEQSLQQRLLVEQSPQQHGLVEQSPQQRLLVEQSPQQRGLVEQSPQQRRLVEQSPQQRRLVKQSPDQRRLVEQSSQVTTSADQSPEIQRRLILKITTRSGTRISPSANHTATSGGQLPLADGGQSPRASNSGNANEGKILFKKAKKIKKCYNLINILSNSKQQHNIRILNINGI